MKHTLVFIVLLLMNSILYGQILPIDNKVNWDKYEIRYSENHKINEVKKIKDDLLVYLDDNKLLEKNLNNFHFIDYDFDGNLELIYSGDAGTETERTLIFELKDTSYIKCFDRFGKIIEIRSELSCNLPLLSFTLLQKQCCGGFSNIYEVYQPTMNNSGDHELKISAKYCTLSGVDVPKSFFDDPILFEVKNDIYYLRLNPFIDKESENEDLHINGNIIAEYQNGSKGYAVASKQDEEGRTWWFVFMINNKKPLMSIFDGGDNNKFEYYSLGWMSSRYLEEMK